MLSRTPSQCFLPPIGQPNCSSTMARDLPIREHDVVKVVRLNSECREYSGTERLMREPRVGDSGTVVYLLDRANPGAPMIVECVDEDGYTVWLAEFAVDELEVVDRA